MSLPASYACPRALATACSVLLGLTGLSALWNAAAVLILGAAPQSPTDTAFLGAGDIVEVLLTLATAVVFIVWLYRVRVNVEVICPQVYQRGRGWTIGAWFIPFANLYLPWRVTADIWNASGPTDRHGVPQPVRTGVVNAWWTAWVVSLVLGRLQAPVLEIASELVTAVAAVLAVLVVHGLTAMQERHAEAARTAAPTFSWVPAEHA
ncbi:DUF4328 domain-containing protein [Kitasatospora sp. NPDC088783]|uniref:DUF4328 domain-containing protein n=1 Tax=Kitasatospora sp. NPDC088783 TaxID=3364077 RepID=UPI00381AAC2E